MLPHHGVNLSPVLPGFQIAAVTDKEQPAIIEQVLFGSFGQPYDHLAFSMFAAGVGHIVVGYFLVRALHHETPILEALIPRLSSHIARLG